MRNDFEMSGLFSPLIQGKRGFYKKKDDGTYVDPIAEAMYQGYKMARKADDAQLKRYDPDRYLANGTRNQLIEELGPVDVDRVVRAVLKIIGGTPV